VLQPYQLLEPICFNLPIIYGPAWSITPTLCNLTATLHNVSKVECITDFFPSHLNLALLVGVYTMTDASWSNASTMVFNMFLSWYKKRIKMLWTHCAFYHLSATWWSSFPRTASILWLLSMSFQLTKVMHMISFSIVHVNYHDRFWVMVDYCFGSHYWLQLGASCNFGVPSSLYKDVFWNHLCFDNIMIQGWPLYYVIMLLNNILCFLYQIDMWHILHN